MREGRGGARRSSGGEISGDRGAERGAAWRCGAGGFLVVERVQVVQLVPLT